MRLVWSVPLALLAGCGQAPDAGAPANRVETAVPAPPVVRASPMVAPTLTPTPTATQDVAPDGAQAAVEVVEHYHALIAAKRYDQAYRLWEPGAAGMTGDAFAASFAKYADYRAVVGDAGRIDAGAGQRYVTVPVRVTGRLASGGDFALEGPMTLHRVADIDGATPEQRSWRIRDSALKPRPR